MDETDLAGAYLRFADEVVAGNKDAPQWAMEALDRLVRDAPDVAWATMIELVARASNARVLAFVAAGPLEDLLRTHGSQLIGDVERLAGSDAKFRRALTGVWISTPSDVAERIQKLVAGEPPL
jgi:hypothetical protein